MNEKTTTGKRVVVGYDATAASERALSWAVARAGADGQVVIVHAAQQQPDRLRRPAMRPNEFARLARARATSELPFLERRDVYDVAECERQVRDDAPASALMAVADEIDAHEIVVGCRRQGRLRSVSGSVSAELLAHSERPVVVVP
jgi:Universal stress protein family.